MKGIDLYPPPDALMRQNCTLEVDDALRTWMHGYKFDFMHIRFVVTLSRDYSRLTILSDLLGSFTEDEWKTLYAQCYENIAPGGGSSRQKPVSGMFPLFPYLEISKSLTLSSAGPRTTAPYHPTQSWDNGPPCSSVPASAWVRTSTQSMFSKPTLRRLALETFMRNGIKRRLGSGRRIRR